MCECPCRDCPYFNRININDDQCQRCMMWARRQPIIVTVYPDRGDVFVPVPYVEPHTLPYYTTSEDGKVSGVVYLA